jgi:hypothetical protein
MAGLGTHAQGYVGVAFETTYGVYAAPTRFFPIKSESLSETFENQRRRVIRGTADTLGTIPGWSRVEGDLEMELIEDVLPYFLFVSRNNVVKTGAGGNYVYTTTPTHWGSSASLPAGKKGLSITIVKNGEVFGFVGCIVGGMSITTDAGIPSVTFTLVGAGEATQSLPTPSFVLSDTPLGAGLYSFEIPTASQVFDVENFTFNANDNPEPQNRLMNTRFARWMKFGERDVTLELNRDFVDRSEWDIYKALTSRSVTIAMTRNANRGVTITLPSATPDTADIDGLSDQGAATMQSLTYAANYDPVTGKSYEIVCKSGTDIT